MPVAYDTVGPSSAGQGQAGGASPLTWSHTCSGSDRLLLVGVILASANDAAINTTVTYAGVAMQSVAGEVHTNAGTAGYAELFYLIAPAVGTNTVAVTITGATVEGLECGSVSLTGAHQSTPIAHQATATGNSNSASTAVASAVGNMVVDLVASGTDQSTHNQTSRWVLNRNNTTGAGNGSQATAAGAASVTMTRSITAVDWWAIIAVDVAAAPAGLPPLSKPAGLIRRVTWHTRRRFTQAIWSTVAVPELGGPLALTAAGSTVSGGTATLGLAVPLAAVGSTASSGTADLGLAVPLAASGTTTSGGTATLSAGGVPVSWHAVATYTSATTVTSAPLVIPADTPIGALMLVGISRNLSTSTPISGVPTDWQAVPGCTGIVDAASSPFTHLDVYSKVCASGEPGTTVTWTWGTGMVVAAALSIYPGGVLGNSNGFAEAGSTAAHVTPTIAAQAESWLVSFFADRSGSTWTPPSGDSERVDIKSTRGTNDSSLELADTNATVTAGNYSKTATATTSSSNAAMAIVEVRPAGAGAGALSATGQTVSGGTATLGLAVPLAATGQTVSAGTAAPSLAVPISATGQTVSGGTASLGLAVPIAATGQTVSAGTAALGLAVPIAAIGQTVSGGTATLSISGQIALTATGQTVSSGTATLGLAVPLAATGQTVSGGTATLGFAVALAATGQTVSGGTAVLVSALAATGQTVSGGTGTLSLARPLTATGQTISGGTAAPSLAVPLATGGTTVSGGTATLSGSGALNATGQTISGGSATPTVAKPLAAIGQTVSSGTATLSLARSLAATGQTVSGGTVAFGRLLFATGQTVSGGTAAFGRLLDAVGQTTSGGTASLRLAVPIAAIGQTTSGGVATLGVARPLQAVGQTTSDGTATLLAFVGEVAQWRGRVTVGRQQPTLAVGRGPARTVPSGPTGARGG